MKKEKMFSVDCQRQIQGFLDLGQYLEPTRDHFVFFPDVLL